MRSKFNLEDRTFLYALHVRKLVKNLPNSSINIEDGRQLIRSSGSVGANYIEANEALSKKDFLYRLRISRKEVKESVYFLKLLAEMNDSGFNYEIKKLITEGIELKKIFSAIIEKAK